MPGAFGNYKPNDFGYGKAKRAERKVYGNMERAQREARQRRTQEAPYTEVGGGEPCDDCKGTGVCQNCNGTSWITNGKGVRSRCLSCRPRGPKASEADRGKCWTCHGKGKKRPTRYRRDGN